MHFAATINSQRCCGLFGFSLRGCSEHVSAHSFCQHRPPEQTRANNSEFIAPDVASDCVPGREPLPCMITYGPAGGGGGRGGLGAGWLGLGLIPAAGVRGPGEKCPTTGFYEGPSEGSSERRIGRVLGGRTGRGRRPAGGARGWNAGVHGVCRLPGSMDWASGREGGRRESRRFVVNHARRPTDARRLVPSDQRTHNTTSPPPPAAAAAAAEEEATSGPSPGQWHHRH